MNRPIDRTEGSGRGGPDSGAEPDANAAHANAADAKAADAAAADSAFSVVEKASPECATVISQWRQQKPWLNALNGAINALNAGQLDSGEALAKRSLILDRKAPYAYSVLGSIAKSRKDFTAANEYWKQALAAAGTDTTYADVRSKTVYEMASAASDRVDAATGAAKRTAAREAIKPWQDYIAVATNDLLVADAIDNIARMYMAAGDSASIPTIYAPLLANPSKYGELALVHAGVVATRNGHNADAAKLFDAALAQNPYSRDAVNNLAATYIQNAEFSKAFPCKLFGLGTGQKKIIKERSDRRATTGRRWTQRSTCRLGSRRSPMGRSRWWITATRRFA